MLSTAGSNSARSLYQEARAMHSQSSAPAPSIRIEHSTSRASGLYSPTKPPRDIARIGKALVKSTRRSVFEGVAIRSNVDTRSVIRNATRSEMSVGKADDCVRLLMNLGILVCVAAYADGEGFTLFDSELMRRFVAGEKIPTAPTEDQLVRRATELIRSVEEREHPRSSEVRVMQKFDIDEVVLALIEASGEEALGDGALISNVVREPVRALQEQFPEIRIEELSSWVELAKFEGYLEEIGDGIWRIQIDRKTPTPSTAPSIDDAIIRLRSQREEAKSRLEQAKRMRQEEQGALEEASQAAIHAFEEDEREKVRSAHEEAKERARSDEDAREAERIQDAQEAFEAQVARIKEEEGGRLDRDLQDAQADFDTRMQRVEVVVENFSAAKHAACGVQNKQRDGDAFGSHRAKIESLDREIQSLERIRDQTSEE